MLAVADVIEYFDRVDMSYWVSRSGWSVGNPGEIISDGKLWNDCGTAGCIAGWTCAWADAQPTGDYTEAVGSVFQIARRELGLTERQAEELMIPVYSTIWGSIDRSKRQDAKFVAQLLRDIANGVVKL